MVRKIILFTLTSIVLLTAKTIVFDIHGVLLKENIAGHVKQKVVEYLEQHNNDTRGLRNSRPFQIYSSLLDIHQPLADLDMYYPESAPVPRETYALFSGQITPEELYNRVKKMLATAAFANDLDRFMVETMVHTIFDREEFAKVLVPLTEGIAIFNTLINHTEHDVYILSNAPREWIELYHDIYDDVFNRIPKERILTSSDAGFLKPEAEIFEYLEEKTNTPKEDIILIDDTPKNALGASNYGITGIHFDYERIEEVLTELQKHAIFSTEQVHHVLQRINNNRTVLHDLDRTFF